MNLKIIEKSVDELIPYVNNARTHSEEQVYQLAASIKEFGFNNPILLDGENGVIAGHGRLMAAKKLKLEKVPCIELSHLSESQKRAFILADNKLALNADWDNELLNIELEALKDDDIDLSLIGFSDDELEEISKEFEEEQKPFTDEEAEEVPEKVEIKCKLGDLWQLGEHRLMCGDSTKEEDVKRLMRKEKANLLLTDPPYGINVVNKSKKIGGDKAFGKVGGGPIGGVKGKIGGGGNIVKSKVYSVIIGDESTDTAKASYDVALMYSENQIIFGGNYFTDFLKPSRCWVVWDKQNTGNFADAELAWTSFDKGVRLYHFLWNGLCREGSREVEGKTRVHPTQKPVGMLENILKDFSQEKNIILDLFGGSGSTLIACEQTKRKARLMELSPHYCSVIIQRFENLTGKKAVLING